MQRTFLLSASAFIVGMVNMGVSIYNISTNGNDGNLTSLVIPSILLVLILILLIIVWRKKEKYKMYIKGHAILSMAFDYSNSITNPDIPDNVTLKADVKVLTDFCTEVKRAFDGITGRDCFVCIKILGEINNRSHLYTLTRDKYSDNQRPSKGEDEDDSKIHWLSKNTGFNSILEDGGKMKIKNEYFFGNDLPKDVSYENSRLEKACFPPKPNFLDRVGLRILHRRMAWHINYQSTIVVPILPWKTTKLNQLNMKGFLCVDSPRIRTFNKQNDVPIMQGLAAGLYNSVRALKARHKLNLI